MRSQIQSGLFTAQLVCLALIIWGCGGPFSSIQYKHNVYTEGLVVPAVPPTAGPMLEGHQVGIEAGITSGYVRNTGDSITLDGGGNFLAATRMHGAVTYGPIRQLNLNLGFDGGSGYWAQPVSRDTRRSLLNERQSLSFHIKARANFVPTGPVRAGFDLGMRVVSVPYHRWVYTQAVATDYNPIWGEDFTDFDRTYFTDFQSEDFLKVRVRPMFGIFGGATIANILWVAGGAHAEMIEDFYGHQIITGECQNTWISSCTDASLDELQAFRSQLAVSPWAEVGFTSQFADITFTAFGSTTLDGDNVIPFGGKLSFRFVLNRKPATARNNLGPVYEPQPAVQPMDEPIQGPAVNPNEG